MGELDVNVARVWWGTLIKRTISHNMVAFHGRRWKECGQNTTSLDIAFTGSVKCDHGLVLLQSVTQPIIVETNEKCYFATFKNR